MQKQLLHILVPEDLIVQLDNDAVPRGISRSALVNNILFNHYNDKTSKQLRLKYSAQDIEFAHSLLKQLECNDGTGDGKKSISGVPE